MGFDEPDSVYVQMHAFVCGDRYGYRYKIRDERLWDSTILIMYMYICLHLYLVPIPYTGTDTDTDTNTSTDTDRDIPDPNTESDHTCSHTGFSSVTLSFRSVCQTIASNPLAPTY